MVCWPTHRLWHSVGWLSKHHRRQSVVRSPATLRVRFAATNPAWAGIASERAGSNVWPTHCSACQDDAFNRTRALPWMLCCRHCPHLLHLAAIA